MIFDVIETQVNETERKRTDPIPHRKVVVMPLSILFEVDGYFNTTK